MRHSACNRRSECLRMGAAYLQAPPPPPEAKTMPQDSRVNPKTHGDPKQPGKVRGCLDLSSPCKTLPLANRSGGKTFVLDLFNHAISNGEHENRNEKVEPSPKGH